MNSGEWRSFSFTSCDLASLNQNLNYCHNAQVLVDCLLLDNEWLIPFEYRLAMMEKAKNLGSNSKAFLIDYYGYKAAFLDPSEEHFQAKAKLNQLLNN